MDHHPEPGSCAWLVIGVVAGAFFMESLDATVIATALPQMARRFQCSAAELSLGITAYLLALAVLIPLSGWVADRFGARAVFGGAIAGFTLASVLCGLSVGLWSFAASRVLQGAAGAMMVPVGRLVVLRQTPKNELLRAVAYLTWPGLVAPVLGPPLGGFLTTYASWRWIFFLNVPLGLAGIVITALVFADRAGDKKRPLDVAGCVLSGTALTALMYGLQMLGEPHPRPWRVASCLGMAAAAGYGAVQHMRGRSDRLFDLSVMRIRTFRTMLLGGSLLRVANGAVPFLLPLLFQLGFHLSAFRSGVLVLAVFAGNLGMKIAAIGVVKRLGFRPVLVGTAVLGCATMLACGWFTAQSPEWLMAAVLCVTGMCRSLQFTAVNSLCFADVPPAAMSGASTLASMTEQMAAGIGIAFGAIALQIGAGAGPVDTAAFRIGFALVALLPLVALADILGLPQDAGSSVSGRAGRAAPV